MPVRGRTHEVGGQGPADNVTRSITAAVKVQDTIQPCLVIVLHLQAAIDVVLSAMA